MQEKPLSLPPLSPPALIGKPVTFPKVAFLEHKQKIQNLTIPTKKEPQTHPKSNQVRKVVSDPSTRAG